MTGASWPLQQAIYARLAADAALLAEIGDPPRLYDSPPRETAYPYALLGDERASAYPGLPGGAEHDIRIGIVSRHGGRREVKRIAAAVIAALDGAALALEGAHLVAIRFVALEAPAGADGVFRGAVRFRAVTQAAGG